MDGDGPGQFVRLAVGLLFGIFTATAASRLISTLLFGVRPVDATVYVVTHIDPEVDHPSTLTRTSPGSKQLD